MSLTVGSLVGIAIIAVLLCIKSSKNRGAVTITTPPSPAQPPARVRKVKRVIVNEFPVQKVVLTREWRVAWIFCELTCAHVRLSERARTSRFGQLQHRQRHVLADHLSRAAAEQFAPRAMSERSQASRHQLPFGRRHDERTCAKRAHRGVRLRHPARPRVGDRAREVSDLVTGVLQHFRNCVTVCGSVPPAWWWTCVWAKATSEWLPQRSCATRSSRIALLTLPSNDSKVSPQKNFCHVTFVKQCFTAAPATEKDLESFLLELFMMKRIGRKNDDDDAGADGRENVINLLGCCTQGIQCKRTRTFVIF